MYEVTVENAKLHVRRGDMRVRQAVCCGQSCDRELHCRIKRGCVCETVIA